MHSGRKHSRFIITFFYDVFALFSDFFVFMIIEVFCELELILITRLGFIWGAVVLCCVGSGCTGVKECHESPNSEWNQM